MKSRTAFGVAVCIVGLATVAWAADEREHPFVMSAARGGMAEVKLGQLALQKASSADVKQFAQHMVDDHSKANESLIALAQRKNIKLSGDMGEENQKVYNKLEKLSGAKFDKAYMKHMVEDHEKDVKEFEEASKDKSKADDIRAWAKETLPTLRNHLQMAKDIEKKLGK